MKFTDESFQIFKEELVQIILFQKIKENTF